MAESGVNYVATLGGQQIKPGILEALLDCAGSDEADALGGFDLHGFASLGVAALACSAGGNLESAESDQLNALVFFDTFGDRVENGFQCFTCVLLCGFATKSFLDGFDELCFIHVVVEWLLVSIANVGNHAKLRNEAIPVKILKGKFILKIAHFLEK